MPLVMLGNFPQPSEKLVVAAADPPPSPFRAEPVTTLVVSLLFNPVGCISSSGIDGRLLINLEATSGPAINSTKTRSMKK